MFETNRKLRERVKELEVLLEGQYRLAKYSSESHLIARQQAQEYSDRVAVLEKQLADRTFNVRILD